VSSTLHSIPAKKKNLTPYHQTLPNEQEPVWIFWKRYI